MKACGKLNQATQKYLGIILRPIPHLLPDILPGLVRVPVMAFVEKANAISKAASLFIGEVWFTKMCDLIGCSLVWGHG